MTTAKIHDSLSDMSNGDDEELIEVIRDAKIDIDVWFRYAGSFVQVIRANLNY